MYGPSNPKRKFLLSSILAWYTSYDNTAYLSNSPPIPPGTPGYRAGGPGGATNQGPEGVWEGGNQPLSQWRLLSGAHSVTSTYGLVRETLMHILNLRRELIIPGICCTFTPYSNPIVALLRIPAGVSRVFFCTLLALFAC